MMKTISSVGVVVFRGERVLLIIKNNHPRHFYQLPGGQIEPNENASDAACRELNETTGLDSKPQDLVEIPVTWEAIIEKDYGAALFTLTCFISKNYTGSIKKTAVAVAEWVDLSRLKRLDLNPNTQNAINAAMKL